MTQLTLFDDRERDYLLPLTFARPVADLRVGSLTLAEKWRWRGYTTDFLVPEYLRPLFPFSARGENLLVNGSLLPTDELITAIEQLPTGAALSSGGVLLAARLPEAATVAYAATGQLSDDITAHQWSGGEPTRLRRPADVFRHNDAALRADFTLLTAGRTSAPLSPTNTLIGPPENLFLEPGARVEACVLNVEAGPIYLGKDSVLLEGCLLRGPVSVGPGAVIKMGARIYGATTLGPHTKVGGEINNVVFQANSNKGHDGYLGNSVIGEWCNIGADTNASNLKNDYGEVRVWSYPEGRFVRTGLLFHGLIFGDHSKAGINTMFNTGTVVGFSSNVYGEGFPRTFIPSFSWGGASGLSSYRLDKALATAQRVMQRRGQDVTAAHQQVFEHIFNLSSTYRSS